jgi:hypothetical protein
LEGQPRPPAPAPDAPLQGCIIGSPGCAQR